MRISLSTLAAITLLVAGASILRAEAPTTQRSADAEAAVKKISLADFDKMRADKDAVVLDVRTPREFAAGHVPGAVNIDWRSRDFEKHVSELDKSKKYLVHCLGGTRSAAATKKMLAIYLLHLYDYSGWWMEYEKSGKPIEK